MWNFMLYLYPQSIQTFSQDMIACTLQKTYHNYTGCVLLVLVVVGCQRKSLSNSHFSCNSNTLFWRASDIVIVDFNAAKLKRKNCPWLSSKHPRTVLLTLGSHRKQKICICEEILKFMDVGVSKTNRESHHWIIKLII